MSMGFAIRMCNSPLVIGYLDGGFAALFPSVVPVPNNSRTHAVTVVTPALMEGSGTGAQSGE